MDAWSGLVHAKVLLPAVEARDSMTSPIVREFQNEISYFQ